MDKLEDHYLTLHLIKILSGKIRCNIGNQIFYIHNPSLEQIYEAEIIYNELCCDAQFMGVLSNEEIHDYMMQCGIWNGKLENELKLLPQIIENLKLDLWNSYVDLRQKIVDKLRVQILNKRKRLSELFNIRSKYDLYTIHGLASFAKIEYLISNNIFCNNKKMNVDTFTLKSIVEDYIGNQLSDDEIRQISKSNMWKSIWSSSKGGYNIFDVPFSILNEEQKSLIGWSHMYDNIYESMDCPPSEVIKDDLLLDGWIIFQQRKHENERKKKLGEKFEKMGNRGAEVFIPVDDEKGAKKVNDLNDPQGHLLKRRKMQELARYGKMREQDFQDSKLEMMRQASQEFQRRARKK